MATAASLDTPADRDRLQRFAESVFASCAISRKDLRRNVIHFTARELAHLRRPTPSSELQADDVDGCALLEQLPTELWQQVIVQSDVQTAFRLRQTSTRFRQLVDSLHEYRLPALHGNQVLAALIKTRLATTVSLVDFYAAFRQKQCDFCGAFAGFMFLPTWNRSCFNCIVDIPQTRVRLLKDIEGHYGFDDLDLMRLTTFQTLPGEYYNSRSRYSDTFTVASLWQAAKIGGSWPDNSPLVRDRWPRFNFMAACAFPVYDVKSGKSGYGYSCVLCQKALEDAYALNRADTAIFIAAANRQYTRRDVVAHCVDQHLSTPASDG